MPRCMAGQQESHPCTSGYGQRPGKAEETRNHWGEAPRETQEQVPEQQGSAGDTGDEFQLQIPYQEHGYWTEKHTETAPGHSTVEVARGHRDRTRRSYTGPGIRDRMSKVIFG